MSEFKNVTVVKKANVFFDGKVASRTIFLEDGSKKSLGFMQPGSFTFNTEVAEIMEFLSGELTVELPNVEEVLVINGTGSFEVPANSKFTVHVTKHADYICSFLK
jgi:uncharacterized protein YaiE (UPF0345 family)